MSELTIKFKGYFEQAKDYMMEKYEELKHVEKDVWMKNAPSIGFLMIYLGYFLFAAKGGSLFWALIFMAGFGYAIFALLYWRKDRDYNLYLSLALLIISFPLLGYEFFSYLLSTVYDKFFY
ncbi:hypothetical protein E3U55_06115 [Filobacillus milosensis]|uniref:Uncharacterized protein n=1 Tax=Filobacillus milosensis TaxID=94137 RepID=A0A4Y8INA4_9BACI|nr:hypothetical protein [Filobacillus milosensis]TFB22809.1 hypothetical protein E3U55_06115 [Filobacillus milosensis]